MSRTLGLLVIAVILNSICLGLVNSRANAATVQTQSCTTGAGTFTCATGITGLSVLDSTWNIGFVLNPVVDIPTFGANASDFGSAINSVLNGSAAVRVLAESNAPGSFLVAGAYTPPSPGCSIICFGTATYYQSVFNTSWAGSASSSFGGFPLGVYVVATEVAPIPLPPAVLLFGTALAGMAGFNRLKRRKQIADEA